MIGKCLIKSKRNTLIQIPEKCLINAAPSCFVAFKIGRSLRKYQRNNKRKSESGMFKKL